MPKSTLLGLVFLSLFLSGCAGAQVISQAHAMPPSSPTPTPYVTPSPAPPTATAIQFQLKPTSTPLPTQTAPVLEKPFGYGPSSFPPSINPLTGLPVKQLELLNRRPMAIKVTNFPRSVRPQWGLSLADHVYEYYLENEITRFIGVFYGNDASRVGPVRSGRFFDEHIVRMYKAIFVFAYADDRVVDPWAESDLRNFLVVEREDNCPPLCRIGSKYNYNTLFANTSQLTEYIRQRGTNDERQNLDGLRFENLVPFSNLPGKQADFYYSFTDYNRWQYDPGTQRYLRSQESEDEKDGARKLEPLFDSLTGEQIAADNLVVLFIPHEYYVHTKTTEMVSMDFFKQGEAIAFRDGQAYEIQWRRAAKEDLLTLTYANGRPYPLKPGNVWFQVIGESSPAGHTPEGYWSFAFAIP